MRRVFGSTGPLVALALGLALGTACGSSPSSETAGPAALETRFDAESEIWQRPAIAYSGYRAGQSPKTGVVPSREQVTEDLHILARDWSLLRVYAADRHAEDVLEVIRRDGLDVRVMLGIWLAREPGAEDENAEQVESGIRMANAYDDIVVAVNVGNEVLIEWTEHPVREESVTRYVREVRAGISQPVTVADNYVWWRDYGEDLAREIDFITIHTYPLWERRDIDEGLSYTIENYEDVRAAHPGMPVVVGEAGWATYTEGNLHVPRGGDERKQERYFRELTRWARDRSVTVFFFEAFDEPWKGEGTEGHWGLFTVDREAKPAMRSRYPDLAASGPTSPSYPERIATAGPDVAAPLRTDFAEAVRTGASVNPMGPGLSTWDVAPAPGAEGDTALRLVLNGESWSGVYVFLDDHDASSAKTLAMNLKLPGTVEAFELKLEGPASNPQSVDILDYVTTRDDAGWATCVVPLSVFDRVDLERVAILGLWNPSDASGAFVSGEVWLDDVRFE